MTSPDLAAPLADDGRRGATLILAATVFAGVAGYLLTWLVYRVAGPAQYSTFAVFWAALYLVVGGLSGIQQEVARATRPIAIGSRTVASAARNFALVAAVVVFAAVTGTAPLWATVVFPEAGWLLVWPLAVGTASYVLVATLCGSLYGVSQWRSLALMIAADGLLRLGLLGLALAAGGDLVVLAWIVALPFPLSILLLWPVIRRGFVGRSDIDVAFGPLVWNVARTSVAAVSTAVLVSGFPLLLGLVSADVSPALIGELVFTITLTRAPLIVTVMSLQSFLVVRFRDRGSVWPLLPQVIGVIAAGAVVLAAAGWWIGPAVLSVVSSAPSNLDGAVIAALVGSSALVAALSVTGAALLARSEHLLYSGGWLVAAVATVVVMFIPLDIVTRTCIALAAGPVVGLLVHSAGLRLRRRMVGAPPN